MENPNKEHIKISKKNAKENLHNSSKQNQGIGDRPSSKALTKFHQSTAQVLSFLNNETSSTLRETLGNIDNIRLRFCSTLQEIARNEENYQKYLKSKQAHSLPVITDLTNVTKLDKAEDVETPPKVDDTEIPEQPILPRIITLVDPEEGSLIQIQEEIKNEPVISHQFPISNVSCNSKEPVALQKLSQSVIKRQLESTLRNKTRSLTLALKTAAKQDISKQLRHRIREIATKLALSNAQVQSTSGVKMCQALPNLHTQLIEEYKSPEKFKQKPDSLISIKDDKQRDAILAEELFVPKRQINKIPSTLIDKNGAPKHVNHKTCHFLYREKRKKRDLMLNIDSSIPEDQKILPVQVKSKTPPKACKSGVKIKQIIVETPPTPKSKLKQKYTNSMFFSDSKASHVKIHADLDSPTEIIIQQTESCKSNCLGIVERHTKNTTAINTTDVETNTATTFKTALNCFDILDEITLADLKPFKSEYPRKDKIGAPPYCTSVEDTLLYQLVYNSNNKQFSQLLQTATPQSHCSSNNCRKCNKLKKGKRTSSQSSSDGPKSKAKASSITDADKNEVAAKLRPFLFDPCTVYPNKTVIVMPVTVHYQNQNFNRPHVVSKDVKQPRQYKQKQVPTHDLISFLKKQNSSNTKLQQTAIPSPLPAPHVGAWGEQMPVAPRAQKVQKKHKKPLTTPVTNTAEVLTNCKILLNIKKATLEKNIQNVIEMIENKIVDTLSNPEKQTPEAFSEIESEILQILDNMRTNPAPLELIEEVGDNTSVTDTLDTTSILKFQTQTILENKADEMPKEQEDTDKTNKKSLIQDIPSTEEHFEVTSSCEPKQQSFDAQVNETVHNLKQTAMEIEAQVHKFSTSQITQTPRGDISPIRKYKPVATTLKTLQKKDGSPEKEKNNTNFTKNEEIKKDTKSKQKKVVHNTNKTQLKEQHTAKKDTHSTLQSIQPTHEVSLNEPEALEIKPDSFLTPFMQAVKQRRNDDRNYQSNSAKNILEFLDALSNISEDLPTKQSSSKLIQVHYKTTLHSSHVLYNPEIYYPIKIEYPLVTEVSEESGEIILNSSNDKVKILFKSKSFACINHNADTKTGDFIPNFAKMLKDKNPLHMLEDAYPIALERMQPQMKMLQELQNEEHGSFLNSIYSVIFTTMFLGLSFNYSCN